MVETSETEPKGIIPSLTCFSQIFVTAMEHRLTQPAKC
jgi:hypothetical protein